MNFAQTLGFLAVLACATPQASAREADPYGGESKEQRDSRMAWWRDAKFGMFIHWGVYAVPAGTFDGNQIDGIGEWIMCNGKIPVDRYRAYAKDFNPVKYDPAAWASLARQTGMRYLVITAKHHDGFCLFPSEVTDWDIADASPYHNDLIGPLAEATRNEGLKFGLYYSQAQDWTHPGGAKAGFNEGDGWDEAHKGGFDAYLDAIAVPQTREILTRYQPAVLWWDTPSWMNEARAARLAALLPLRPGIIHNNRLGGGYPGDTETPEQHIPATGIAGRDWETCMTINNTWGFKSYDHDWKSAGSLIRNLADIVSKGGNYLLNVGPTADGEIPAESVERLHRVGEWMKINGQAIYGTRASPFKRLPWGRCTRKADGDGTLLYLHVFDWPADGRLPLRGLQNPIESITLPSNGRTIEHQATPTGPVLLLPGEAPDPINSIIKLRIKGQPEVEDLPVAASEDGVIRLLPADARLHGRDIRLENRQNPPNIGDWHNPAETVSWILRAPCNGRYRFEIETASPHEGCVLRIEGPAKLAFSIPKTGDCRKYQRTPVGDITLTKDTNTTLTLKPVADGWQPVNLLKVELVPLP